VPPGEEAHMRTIFDLARRSTHGFESYARQVGRLFADDRAVLEDLLGGLFHIALADGALCAAEDAYLREVARLFGFDARLMRASARPMPARRMRSRRIRTRSSASPPAPRPTKSASPIIGWCASTIPMRWSRKACRRRLLARATARIARINAAHDRLVKGATDSRA
jgi:DnaJ like chaperone protein